jgi:hypothetical protein
VEDLESTHEGFYYDLRWGARLYAGTVVSVRVDGKETRSALETGHIRFRVTRTVIGQPKKELILPFDWEEPPSVLPWDACTGKWPGRPQVGERLLLLLLPENEEVCREKFNTAPTCPVLQRWEAGPNSPLAEGFALAGRFLALKAISKEDVSKQDDVFLQLCRHPVRNMREFAREVAFASGPGLDPDRQSKLRHLYLKHAAP